MEIKMDSGPLMSCNSFNVGTMIYILLLRDLLAVLLSASTDPHLFAVDLHVISTFLP